jgi:hypothetical protein
VLDDDGSGPDVSGLLVDDSLLAVVVDVLVIVVLALVLVIGSTPDELAGGVLPVDPSSATHSPAIAAGARSANRFIEGHVSSGKLQYPSSSQVPALPARTHCSSLSHAYATGWRHPPHAITPNRTTRRTSPG